MLSRGGPRQPLRRGHAGHAPAHLRPPRRRRDDMPRRRALRPAAGAARARRRDRPGAAGAGAGTRRDGDARRRRPDARLPAARAALRAGRRCRAARRWRRPRCRFRSRAGSGFVTLSRVLTRDDGDMVDAARDAVLALAARGGAAGQRGGGDLGGSRRAGRAADLRARPGARRCHALVHGRGSIRPLRGGRRARRRAPGHRRRASTPSRRVPLRSASGALAAKVRLRRPAVHRLRIESRRDARNRAGRSRDVILRAIRPRR